MIKRLRKVARRSLPVLVLQSQCRCVRLRRSPPDAFGNVISTFISSERLHPWKAENTSTFPWDFAASYTKKLHNSIPRTRETIGSLKYLFGNYDGFFLSKLGKKRQMGIELSNLGAFTVNVGDNGDSGAKTSWTIGGDVFRAG